MSDVDDQDRRDIINALDRENPAARTRILATPDAFSDWLRSTLYLIFLKARDDLEPLWAWLRLAYA
ncbi:hypothetical protein J2S43_003389 [Catenuloplanes nepalensis]|uniref:Uncharacterized protein n=1 Tax=Catenuloplanes nepalensis TaxID=587533 RepID=A0ABT9MTW3_9ACTN|nr:hypothetical protein [Catenuloplanes nepalensis]MDP9794877.1 hypothetical protein [Catenuloplanes nepalensis]